MEPFHDKLTVVGVIAVTVRLVGVVGADRSPLPAADVTDRSTRRTIVKASAAIVMIRREERRVVMIDLPLDEQL